MAGFAIVRDQRGSLVHVRRADSGECVGCIEVGLFEIVRAAVLAEARDRRVTREEGDLQVIRPPQREQ